MAQKQLIHDHGYIDSKGVPLITCFFSNNSHLKSLYFGTDINSSDF